MTVRYHSDLSSASFLGSTLMILRWKGSLWKAVYQELIVWLIIYAILSCTYAFWLNDHQKKLPFLTFEQVVNFCNRYGELIPLTFMLGFYVTLVVERWWGCITRLGLIDNVAVLIANRIRGESERAALIRCSILRYLTLIQVMIYRAISTTARRKFPTLESLVEAEVESNQVKGYLEKNELARFRENNFWICIQWAMSLARTARDENIIQNDFALEDIFKVFLLNWLNFNNV
ncbi:unnamed protein product [Enterobius vermicularis]|uniref:Bestrophin homolog n=1 Tax=Enterobius vermicularis TaxID=51028 RepID=A0A0N4VQJ8_ENTVE|nr:unnamed protein product [Enterobius vermicularis]